MYMYNRYLINQVLKYYVAEKKILLITMLQNSQCSKFIKGNAW